MLAVRNSIYHRQVCIPAEDLAKHTSKRSGTMCPIPTKRPRAGKEEQGSNTIMSTYGYLLQ